ncbi:lysophospholipid acyltransferase family protein [uncultured Litoreibacter sp.]|uniref:lysophospholipid acyltransferase family protein n=1 Tax=uncultured Litoreibacter sp. TaxID=1392394 RepID=UPI002621E240|nr:lysophospholipid acyltransferase family protein [uncultured Litoreibacter sp.]
MFQNIPAGGISPMGHATRDISYAHSAQTRAGRALIRTMENATGRIALIKRARGYEQEVARGADFWSVMVRRYGLSLDCAGGTLDNIPKDGPVIAIANHPFGILDGLMMGQILNRTRGDFRILANDVFGKAQDINRVILPISFDETRQAVAQNIATRREALNYMGNGGAIGIFPGGTVSTAARPFSAPMDPGWRSFTSKLITRSGAQVVPIYFEGRNSRLFQLASHAHQTLRLGLLMNEFKRQVDKPVRVVIGSPIATAALDNFRHDPKAMMDFLRQSTYDLSPTPMAPAPYGFEFEEKHRRAAHGGRHF